MDATEDNANQAIDREINYNVFISEISEQCRFVLMAVSELEKLEGLDRSLRGLLIRRFEERHERFGFPPMRSADATEFESISSCIELQGIGLLERLRHTRYHVDNIIDHAARIERMLWPVSKTKGKPPPQRGEKLRQQLGVADSSPLRARVRNLRNGWQHMDERIDASLAKGRSKNAKETTPDSLANDFGLSRDPGLTVESQGERVELEPVIDEIRILLAKCQLARGAFEYPEMALFYKMQLER